jgi:4-amino-4-deoxy-L-arabinose transferase-like glycosyltransferase
LPAVRVQKEGMTDLGRVRFTEVVSRKRTRKAEFLFVVILLLLSLTLFFFQLGRRPLWDIDEGMHAATSKHMVLSGDWITPQFNGENFYDKPILYNWLAAISFLVFGFTEFAARLPAATLGLGCVMVTYLLGRKMFGPTVGFLSGVILATNGEYIILSRGVIHDIALVFFLTLALFFFYMGFKNERQRKTHLLLFYASAGFAVLAKGPVGVLLPALIIVFFLLVKGKLGFLREMEIGWGILIFLAIAAPWYVLISLRNKDFVGYFFIQQNLLRFLSPMAHHHRPFYYYFPVLLGGFSPWSCFLPLAFIHALRGRFEKVGDGTIFLIVWFVVIFLFFSMASSKLATYILPLFPAVSLLVGILWHELLEAPTPWLRKGFSYSFITLLGILALATFYMWMNPPTRFESMYGVHLTRLNYLLLWVVGGGAASFWLFLNKKFRASFSTMAGTVVSVILFIILAMLPSIDPYRSTKGLARELDMMLPPGEKLVFFDKLWDSALFYTNRRAIVLSAPQQLKDFLASGRRVFCVIDKTDLEKFEAVKHMTYVLGKEGSKLLISNRQSS